MSTLAMAQDNTVPNDSIVSDTTATKYPKNYGLRLGFDVFKIARTAIDDEFTGFEIVADYRLKKNLYVAAELGNDERTISEDFFNATAEGTYVKAGVDFNLYENWLGLDNLIYSGFRIAGSTFTQTVNEFTVFNRDQSFTQGTFSNPIESDDLNAIWSEVIFGIKAEVLNNLYVTLQIQFKYLVNEDEPDNFQNLFIPGFNRVSSNSDFGFGIGYNIAYLIPFKKK